MSTGAIAQVDPCTSQTLLIGLGAPVFRNSQGDLFVEDQTVSGLHAWSVGFDKIIAYAIKHDEAPPVGWSKVCEENLPSHMFEFVELPYTYKILPSLGDIRTAKRLLRAAIERSDYLVFSYGGWIGDPGELAAAEARKLGRDHAVWLDRVEATVMAQHDGSVFGRCKAFLKSFVTARYANRAVRLARLSLLHGRTVFEHFEPMARNPQIAEDLHLVQSDIVPPDLAMAKADSCMSGPLKVLYAGRIAKMKGWADWLSVVSKADALGVQFEAKWIGEGEDRDAMFAQAQALQLTNGSLSFEGFISDRRQFREELRAAHVFVFCHLTDESPRNLVESLLAATPLIGYRDAYSAELVDEKNGGILVDRGDTLSVAKVLAELDHNRERLRELILAASGSAHNRTREAVFAERIKLVHEHLG